MAIYELAKHKIEKISETSFGKSGVKEQSGLQRLLREQILHSHGENDDPRDRLLEFLEWDELDEDDFAQDVRIVLVSADFSRELTTAVMWLNEKDLDIRCVRIKPYEDKGRTLIDVQQIIPYERESFLRRTAWQEGTRRLERKTCRQSENNRSRP